MAADAVPYRAHAEFPLLFGASASAESLRVVFGHEDKEVAVHVIHEARKVAFALFHLKVTQAQVKRHRQSVLVLVRHGRISTALGRSHSVGAAESGHGAQGRAPHPSQPTGRR